LQGGTNSIKVISLVEITIFKNLLSLLVESPDSFDPVPVEDVASSENKISITVINLYFHSNCQKMSKVQKYPFLVYI